MASRHGGCAETHLARYIKGCTLISDRLRGSSTGILASELPLPASQQSWSEWCAYLTSAQSPLRALKLSYISRNSMAGPSPPSSKTGVRRNVAWSNFQPLNSKQEIGLCGRPQIIELSDALQVVGMERLDCIAFHPAISIWNRSNAGRSGMVSQESSVYRMIRL